MGQSWLTTVREPLIRGKWELKGADEQNITRSGQDWLAKRCRGREVTGSVWLSWRQMSQRSQDSGWEIKKFEGREMKGSEWLWLMCERS